MVTSAGTDGLGPGPSRFVHDSTRDEAASATLVGVPGARVLGEQFGLGVCGRCTARQLLSDAAEGHFITGNTGFHHVHHLNASIPQLQPRAGASREPDPSRRSNEAETQLIPASRTPVGSDPAALSQNRLCWR